MIFLGTFQIVKKLLPKKVVEHLHFINSKNIHQYIDDDNTPIEWGGKNDYVFNFVSENCQNDEPDDGNSALHAINNNIAEQADLNSLPKKVSLMMNYGQVDYVGEIEISQITGGREN